MIPGPIPAELYKKDVRRVFDRAPSDRPRTSAESAIERVSHLSTGGRSLRIRDLGETKIVRPNHPFGHRVLPALRRGHLPQRLPDVVRHPRLTRAFIRIVKALDPDFHVLAQFNDTELPIDDFFRRQVDRVGAKDDAVRDRQLVPGQRDHVVRGTAGRNRLSRSGMDRRFDASGGNNSYRMRFGQVTGRRCSESVRQ